MARVWTNNSGLEINAANLNAMEADIAAGVPRFRPNYTYTKDTIIVSPAGDVVLAAANFTSTSSYNSANWVPTSATTALLNRVSAVESSLATVTSLSNRVTAVESKNTAQDNRLTALENATPDPGSGGGSTGGGIAPMSSHSASRLLVGARVGSGSLTPPGDDAYFDLVHELEAEMNAKVDITNWYRGLSETSAAEFTATVKPELAANPNLIVNYVFELDKSNAQFNKEYNDKSGSYPHVLATLQAIKNSGYADRVTLAPFHEGNGGGGTAGSIGAYDWHMYDTDLEQLYTPNSSDPFNKNNTGVRYGSPIRQNSPAQYKTAFRNIVNMARSIGLPCKIIQWFLAANSSDSIGDGVDRMDMSPGYAGDDYVDIIGLSYYNRSGDIRYSDTWPQPGSNGLREFYNAYQRMGTKNPLWICETGCAMSNQWGDKGQWYADLIRLCASDEMPRIEGMIMFMQDTRKAPDANGEVAGMNMKLENLGQKKMVGRAINAIRRTNKFNDIPPFTRNLLPISVSDCLSIDPWTTSVGVTLAVGRQYAPRNLDSNVNGMRVTKTSSASGDTKTTYNIYRDVNSSNIDYVPNDPYVLSFWARASIDQFELEAGIRQDSGAATMVSDELYLTQAWEQYVVPFSSITADLNGFWRFPNFNFGTNPTGSWFEIAGLRLSRGTYAQPNVESTRRPKFKAITNAANLTWNCEVADIYTVTVTQSVTLMAPTGVPYDGQEISLRVTQDGVGGRNINLHSSYLSPNAPLTVATAPGAMTFLKFQYVESLGKWGLMVAAPWTLT